MEFRQLKTFRVVSQLLSFTRAAEQLHMAQSSVSAQIRGLEEEFGVMLFDRIGRRVMLTDAGRKLHDYACRIEGMTDDVHMKDVNVVFLKTLELVLAASLGHPLAARGIVQPGDLTGQTILYPKTD